MLSAWRPRAGSAGGWVTRLAHEQDWDVVAHRVGKTAVGAGADKLIRLFVNAQRRVALGARQDLKQPVVNIH
jgi:hypothetical protein